MSSHLSHTEPNTLPYRYTNNQASDAETVSRSASRLPNPMFSQSPVQFSSRYIPSESGSVLGTSTARFANPEQQAYTSMGDITCRGDCCYRRARGCDAHALNYPLDLPSTQSRSSVTSPTSTIDPLSHGTPAHPVFFTDDAKMKLGDRIRRQCFNCRTTVTKAWRRSVLSPGKMVCNKCGLFERTHAVPRPNNFPRRHHLRPTPVYTNMGHPFDHAEYCHHDDSPSVPPLTTDNHFPNSFGPTGEETSSQDTTWVNHGALPPTSHLSPSYTVSPQSSSTLHHPDSHLSSTVPVEAARLPSHHGVSRHPPSVVENRYFDASERRYQVFPVPSPFL